MTIVAPVLIERVEDRENFDFAGIHLLMRSRIGLEDVEHRENVADIRLWSAFRLGHDENRNASGMIPSRFRSCVSRYNAPMASLRSLFAAWSTFDGKPCQYSMASSGGIAQGGSRFQLVSIFKLPAIAGSRRHSTYSGPSSSDCVTT